MIIDAHHHLWRFDPGQYGWIAEGDVPLRQDFLLPELERTCTANRIARTVVVQARQSLDETRWLLDLAAHSPRIAGVVGWVPLADPGLPDLLAPLIGSGLLKGVRHVVQGETDPAFLLRPEIARGLHALPALDLAYDLLVLPHQLGQAAACVDAHADVRFVLDHAAKPPYASGDLTAWERDLRALARRPNVWCKLSGLATETGGRGWDASTLAHSVDVLLDAFGPRRLLFGSDWPVCLLATGYDRWLGTVQGLLDRLTADERTAILGGNATTVYRL